MEKDPYFSIQDEVIKYLDEAKILYNKWIDCLDANTDQSDLTLKLRQILKNIDWDLLDIKETISAVERNPSRFNISNKNFSARRQFLIDVESVVKSVKDNLSSPELGVLENKHINFSVPIAPRDDGPISNRNIDTINNEFAKHDDKNSMFRDTDPLSEQKQLLFEQDERLKHLGVSISTLKGMSHRIGDELGDQVLLLNEFSDEIAHTESRLDAVTKRTARLLRLTTNKRQWYTLITLVIILMIILTLLVVL